MKFQVWFIDYDRNDDDAQKKCLLKYQEKYFGPALVPETPGLGSVIVAENNKTKRYFAEELGKKVSLCGQFDAWTTGQEGIFFRIVEGEEYRVKLKPILPENIQLGAEISMLSQYVQTDVFNRLKESFIKTTNELCEQRRHDLFTTMAILSTTPNAGNLLGK